MGNRNSLVLNSEFEESLRILLVLYNQRNTELSCTEIIALDILTIYGENYCVSENNLNGNNPYSYLEYLNRQLDGEKEIKKLILKGLVKINYSNKGYTYSITPKGITYIDSLESQYVQEYLEINTNVIYKYSNLSNDELERTIKNISCEED